MANYGFQSWRQISTNHKISQQSDLKEIQPPQSDSHRKHCLVCPLCPAQPKWELKLWAVVSLWLFHTVCVRCTGPHFRHLCHPAPAGCSSIPAPWAPWDLSSWSLPWSLCQALWGLWWLHYLLSCSAGRAIKHQLKRPCWGKHDRTSTEAPMEYCTI